MIVENLTVKDFFGCMIFLPFFIYFTLTLLDGLGIFKDVFFTSNVRRRI